MLHLSPHFLDAAFTVLGIPAVVLFLPSVHALAFFYEFAVPLLPLLGDLAVPSLPFQGKLSVLALVFFREFAVSLLPLLPLLGDLAAPSPVPGQALGAGVLGPLLTPVSSR